MTINKKARKSKQKKKLSFTIFIFKSIHFMYNKYYFYYFIKIYIHIGT